MYTCPEFITKVLPLFIIWGLVGGRGGSFGEGFFFLRAGLEGSKEPTIGEFRVTSSLSSPPPLPNYFLFSWIGNHP
jgi:hypothetical protein